MTCRRSVHAISGVYCYYCDQRSGGVAGDVAGDVAGGCVGRRIQTDA